MQLEINKAQSGMLPQRISGQDNGEFLAFKLGEEEYGVDILNIQEIRRYESVTRIANAPEHIRGVINLRGIIVPILDLRIRFGIPNPVYGQFTVVIIISLGHRVIGVVVDAVSDVITLTSGQIKPVPEMHAQLSADFLIGLGIVDARMLILVDIEKLVSEAELSHIATQSN